MQQSLAFKVSQRSVMKPTLKRIYSENSDFQYIETIRRNRTKRKKSGEFFVEGVRLINQAVRLGWQINALIFTPERRLSDWAVGILDKSNAKVHYELSPYLMDQLSMKENHSELIALIAAPPDDLSRIPNREKALVVVLDRPSSPGNLGSVIRSCDALGAHGLVITGHSADLYDPETIRATTGSFFQLPAVRLPSHKDLQPWLIQMREQAPELQVVGTAETAKVMIQDFDFTKPTILLAGNETHGLSEAYRSLSDAMVAIPMYGSASSLNLASATSIVLYEIDRQRRLQNQV